MNLRDFFQIKFCRVRGDKVVGVPPPFEFDGVSDLMGIGFSGGVVRHELADIPGDPVPYLAISCMAPERLPCGYTMAQMVVAFDLKSIAVLLFRSAEDLADFVRVGPGAEDPKHYLRDVVGLWIMVRPQDARKFPVGYASTRIKVEEFDVEWWNAKARDYASRVAKGARSVGDN